MVPGAAKAGREELGLSVSLSFRIFLFQPRRKEGARPQGCSLGREEMHGPVWCHKYLPNASLLPPWPTLCRASGMGVTQLWSLPSRRGGGCRALEGRTVTGRYKVP